MRLIGLAKAGLRLAVGRRGFTWLACRYVWGKTLINYLLFRVPGLSRVRAWPHTLYLEATNVCNARCVFCAYPQMRRPKQSMPLDLFRSAVAQFSAIGGGDVDVTSIVGDPFVDRHLQERLDILAAAPRIRRFSFFTNAIAMDPSWAPRLLRYGARLQVFISFGGFDRPTYQRIFGVDRFDAASANIRALVEAKRGSGSPTRIQVNLRTPRGSHHGEFWDYLVARRREGVIEMTWMGAYDSWGGHVPDAQLLAAGLTPRPHPVKKGPCHRLLTSPVILADGRVNACACRDVEAGLIIGDLRSDPLSGILSGRPLRDLVERHSRGDFPEVCQLCTYYDPVLPYWWIGQPPRPDPSTPEIPED